MVYVLAFAMALASCGGNTGKTSEKETADSAVIAESDTGEQATDEAQSVRERVESIYADVFGWYAKDTLNSASPDFESRYMSSGYNVTYAKVDSIDTKNVGMVGLFDYNHWVCGQDWGDLSMKVMNVEKTGNKSYKAEIEVHNLGTTTHVNLTMVEENGQWLIDDIQQEGIQESEKTRMTKYIEENK